MARHGRWRGAAGAAAAATVVGASAAAARRRRVGAVEERVFRCVNGATGLVEAPTWLVMQAGSLGAVLAASAVTAARGDPRTGAAIGICGTTVWAGVKAVKPLIGRGRPEAYLPDVAVRGARQSGLGYPSGHAAVGVTLALLAPASSRRRRSAALAIAGVTGMARMYVGAHLPLDIAGGAGIGVLAGGAGAAWLARPG